MAELLDYLQGGLLDQPADGLIPPPYDPGIPGRAAWAGAKEIPGLLGIPDAMRALRGQMTPAEAQTE